MENPITQTSLGARRVAITRSYSRDFMPVIFALARMDRRGSRAKRLDVAWKREKVCKLYRLSHHPLASRAYRGEASRVHARVRQVLLLMTGKEEPACL